MNEGLGRALAMPSGSGQADLWGALGADGRPEVGADLAARLGRNAALWGGASWKSPSDWGAAAGLRLRW